MSTQREAERSKDAIFTPHTRPLRVAAIGVSTREICGVRDQAELLAAELDRLDIACSMHWLQREHASMRSSRGQFQAWTKTLVSELQEQAADAVLLHYSVFTYAYQGVPFFVRPVFAAARHARIPVITVLHEFVFPWKLGGAAGKLWAASQRLSLIGVMRASAATIVTTEGRREWLESRRWLVRRPTAVAPVFSNLPPADATLRPDPHSQVLGLFGYAHDASRVALILDALRLLADRGLFVQLLLLGAPGAGSAQGTRWLTMARERGIGEALKFSGTLSAQDLSNRLAQCDVLLFADRAGPTSRKTTLAASLASGRPVLALDGPQRWRELVESEAARMVAPTAEGMAAELTLLLTDEGLRESVGTRGRAFAERMGLAHSAGIVARTLREAVQPGSLT